MRLARLSVLLLFAATGAATGQGTPAEAEKASFELLAERTAFAPGTTGRLAAVMSIEEGWHTNSHEPTFDYLIPTTLELELPARWPPARVAYPPGEMKTFAFAGEPLSVYEGEVTLTASFEIPEAAGAGAYPVTARLTYQACDDRTCLPPVTAEERLEIAVGEGGEPAPGAAAAFGGQGDPLATATPSGRADAGARGLAVIVGLALLGGLILNAMPCVLPVLSLKVFGLVQSAGRGRREVVRGALMTALGILVSFWALAGAAAAGKAAGAAVGWGIQFQEPVFVALLTVVVLLFCLNLWGLFEITLPSWLARKAGAAPREGLAGHFVSGLFATLMATPCSAPFLGTALGFALAQQAGVILATFTAVGLGMALPYLVLAAAPGTASLLPRPGPWMSHVKTFMGFLLAGAAVWLLYVLAGQLTPESLAFLELALLALALCVWLRHRAGHVLAAGAAGAGIALAVAVTVAIAAQAPAAASEAEAEPRGLIAWVEFDRQEAERLAAQGRLVFVDVTADWCFTCKVNERLVLETAEVAAAFARHEVVAMKADWTNRDDEIARYLAAHGRYGIPFYLLYRPGAEPHLFGELITQEELIRRLAASAAAGPA